MANGSAALLTLEPPAAPVQAPPEDEPEMAMLRRIGEITADATVVLAIAMQEFSADGSMAARTRTQGGELFVQLYQLQQVTMTDDFPSLMRIYGGQVLWKRNAGAGLDKAAFDRGAGELIDSLCSVLARITETERVYAIARAN